MRNTAEITGVKVDKVTMDEALENIRMYISEGGIHIVYTPNAEIMMDAQKFPDLKAALNAADMVVADGAGVVLASKILGTKVPEKVSGVDLVRKSFSSANLQNSKDNKRNKVGSMPTYFFFGSKPGIAEMAKQNVERDYPGIKIVGTRDGYFSEDQEDEIIERINNSGADILLVALGAPKQEIWISKNLDKLDVKVCIGVGGTLDILAGTQKLAPDFFRNHGLEWFYRLIKEPGRFFRMLKLPKFILLVIFKRLQIK